MTSTNLSGYDEKALPPAKGMKFAIILTEWNNEITEKLKEGAYSTLLKAGVLKKNISTVKVPGSFEITFAALLVAENKEIDGVICLGCIIQGETPHFRYICQSVTYGLTKLNLIFDIPFIFGILTTGSKQQALDRAGGRLGNKGIEAAITAIKMVDLKRRLIKPSATGK